MIKLTLFLACVVLMGSAMRDVYNQTQGSYLRSSFLSSAPIELEMNSADSRNDSFITLPGSMGSFVEMNNGTQNNSFITLPGSMGSFVEMNNGTHNDSSFISYAAPPAFVEVSAAYMDNSTMPEHVPASFVETSVGQVSVFTITRDLFLCGGGYSYLTYNDHVNNRQKVCNNMQTWGIYRLEGGASADGQGYQCKSRPNDPRILGDTFCVATSISEKQKGTSEDCPSGFARISFEEANSNKQSICSLLNTWDIARLGVRGSISGPGYGCEVKDWDDRGLGHSLCVKRSINGAQSPNTNEEICGSNKSPMTVEDVMRNRQAICNSLGTWYIARLAGGASMDGPGYGCKVRERDRRSLGHAVCANGGRAL